jgi:hypothetical protein
VTPSTPPTLQPSDVTLDSPAQRRPGHWLAVIATTLLIGSMIGVAVAAYRLVQVFGEIAETGTNDPEALAGPIRAAQLPALFALPAYILGLILVAIALFGQKYRAKWFFWFLIAYSILMLTAFPVGTVLGIGLLIYLIVKRKAFLAPAAP